MERTVRLRLYTTWTHEAALYETTAQFTASFNHVCTVGWQQRNGNAYTLHHLTYRDCKAAHPALVSDLHIQARQKASEAVNSAVRREKRCLPTRCPQSVSCPPRYNRHTFRVDWTRETVNLATTQGRLHLPFTLPAYAAYAQGHQVTTADLIHRNGRWFLHIVVLLPDIPSVDNGTALGVDLGVTHPAVSSDNRFHGKRHWREVTKRRLRFQRKLQANGSKSAKRHLRSLAGREQRFWRDCDHVLSASIVSAVEPGTTIVIENLTNIRKRVKA
jgi:transposase